MEQLSFFSAFVIGLMGAGHCFAMCGGIIGSLSMATSQTMQKWWILTLYQLGRICSYTLFGFIAGLLGQGAQSLSPIPLLPVLSGVLLILMGLYISRLWMALGYLERAGKKVWNHISPLGKRLLPVKNYQQAFFLGSLWGWLPCGLVYTSLGYALSLASPLASAGFMLAFGLGTLPATLTAGSASLSMKQWLNRNSIRYLVAILFVGFGIYTLLSFYLTLSSGQANHHHH